MDIHKPKPFHGWREFLKEYGIIVLGVLTALGAEQVVEQLHWRHEIHVAREAVAFDLKRVIGMAAMKDAASPCEADRLAQFTDALDEAQVTHRLPPLGWSGGPPLNAWSIRSWARLQAGQTLAHMTNHDQLFLASVASYMEYARQLRAQESEHWGRLTTMVGPGRPTSDAEIASLRAAIGGAGQNAAGTREMARQVETVIVRSGFLTPAEVDAAYKDGRAHARAAPICGPRAAPPAHSRDMIIRGLDNPSIRPGEAPAGTIGVAGALSTEQ